ncbi:MAG: CCA tRNA nucleotidyltransferase [Acidobacteria bacterium]|nr:CCA tRNA nucleotidyltransferase [Acidobacteriota bacterium]
MSDYMFMLENHLSPGQNRAVALVEAAARESGVRAFLTGGALRDMLGGFPIRDLDFTIEGPTQKIVRLLEKRDGVRTDLVDPPRKAYSLVFADGVKAEISIAHEAQYLKPGARPRIRPATIHEDLKRRDFTINSIAISLNPASRGLLLDPENGLGDLERRELRTNSNYTLYDDPSRILRMFRLRARLGFDLNEKTQSQYHNVREAGLESKIPAEALRAELREMAEEPNPAGLLETLERERLIGLFSPALSGVKLNAQGFAKLLKIRQMVPFGVDFHASNLGLFLHTLFEKFTDRERKDLIKRLKLTAKEASAPKELAQRAKKLERVVGSPKLNRASLVYKALRSAPGEEVLFLMAHSEKRIVHDRVKNYLTKYLETANEVTDKDLAPLSLDPGSKEFAKAKLERVYATLDGRIRKPAPPPPPPPAPPTPMNAWARRG